MSYSSNTGKAFSKGLKYLLQEEAFLIRKLNFSKTEYIFYGTQAFTSPTDMASSGVWENVILSKTPTFGVYVECYSLQY